MFRRLGHDAEVISCDTGREAFLKKLAFKPLTAGPSHFRYAYSQKLVSLLESVKNDFDGMIVHGMWQYQSLAVVRAFRNDGPPYVVFPHGNLDPYFIDNFPLKHVKKSLHYRLIESRLFKRARAVLFTCDEERRLAANSYRPVSGNHVTVHYGIDPPDFEPAKYDGPFRATLAKLAGKHLVLFFGRIHPKKGCDLLVDAFAQTANLNPQAHLLMVGPDETGWVPKLQARAEQRRISDRISWLGPAYGADKWFLFSSADVFILPSHMENFGIAITEAMSRRVPVLISTKINIHSDITAAGAGFAELDNAEGTANLLRRWFQVPDEQRSQMGERAKELVEQKFLSIDAARDIIRIFSQSNRVPQSTGAQDLRLAQG
jgi:glycosyltransferase involved in cell wall biosynthesis